MPWETWRAKATAGSGWTRVATTQNKKYVCVGEAGLYGNFASEYGYEIETSSQRQRVRWGLFSFQKSGRLEKTVWKRAFFLWQKSYIWYKNNFHHFSYSGGLQWCNFRTNPPTLAPNKSETTVETNRGPLSSRKGRGIASESASLQRA